MIYTFLSSVFITLFLVTGTIAFCKFIERMVGNYPVSWTSLQHVIILAVIAAICFILAVLFGFQIPNGYVR